MRLIIIMKKDRLFNDGWHIIPGITPSIYLLSLH